MPTNPNAPPEVSPDSAEIPPGSNLWYEGAYDPPHDLPPGVPADPNDPRPSFNPNHHNPEVPVEGLVGNDKIVQDSIDNAGQNPYPKLVPTADNPSPSIETPAGTYTWDPSLNALRNISVEAPNAADLPWGLEVYLDQLLLGKVLVSDRFLLRDIMRGLTFLYRAKRDNPPFLQFRGSYNTGATVTWTDPSLDDPPVDTFKRWPADWNGITNAELRINTGLGDKV